MPCISVSSPRCTLGGIRRGSALPGGTGWDRDSAVAALPGLDRSDGEGTRATAERFWEERGRAHSGRVSAFLVCLTN